MSKSLTPVNAIIGLTVMLLMIVALVASQADASIQEEVQASYTLPQGRIEAIISRTPGTAITTQILGHPLTIEIERIATFSHFSFELD